MSLNMEFFNKIKSENKLKDSYIDPILIRNQISFLFPNLKKDDFEILLDISIYLINFISNKFHFTKESNYKDIWIENNYRNIKSAILKVLPFIDDKDNFRLYKKIYDLNQILLYINQKNMPKDIFDISMSDSLKNYFPISNFTLGLTGAYENKEQPLLQFYDDNGEKLIYEIMHHNFVSLLESIKICSSKLYVNWINIIPIHIETLLESDIYKKTKDNYKKISNISDNSSYREFEKDYNGLNIADFYNVFRNGYFKNIKNIKWLIFNKIPKDFTQNKPIGKYYIQLLEEYLDISYYKEYPRYSGLSDDLKYKFDENMKKMILLLESKFEINEMMKTIIMFLVNNYNYRNTLDKSIIDEYKLSPIELEKTEINDLEYNKSLIEKTDKKSSKEIINDINKIGNEHFYNYISESIDQFRSTIYSSFLIDNNDKIKLDFFNIKIINENNEYIDTNINLKNLYNIAKTLSHNNQKIQNNQKKQWIIQKEFFVSLSLAQRIHFFGKFTNENTQDWLDIRNNIQSQIQNSSFNESTVYNNIKESWNNHKIYFIFYYLCQKGLLSKFIPNPSITNDSILPSNYKTKMKVIGKKVKKTIEDENLKEAYYYLNNKKYGDLENFYEKKDETILAKSYFERLEKDLNWYTFYAMDWMAQISFFHTYINHQVLFVTGSTGTGKSTQVPKLLLYSLKCIDYREDGKIMCTQPRIPPTVGNAKRISEELGVPISIYNSSLDLKINSENYQVQFKHQNGEHTSLSNNLNLKIATDGTLFEEIIDNPLMKDKLFDKKKEDYEFSLKNKYDIIIVDEAHEHGKNMDLILSLARNTCYYNNSVRLIIISATMEDDEPNYRSYYKYINDNMLYPIKKPLVLHPLLDIKDFLPQTIFMERRFHISKPGETTQFKIEEISKSVLNEDQLEKPWEAIQNKSYDVVNEILSENPNGNILLFLTGEREIKEAVEKLNKIIPSDAVAIPFYSSMNEKYKELIGEIDRSIKYIKNDKFKIHEEWGPNFEEGKNMNNFTRAVIIATNVAEASITIPNLKFVVDNGYSKQNNFSYETGESILKEEMISNSSRVQRKGRVGRNSDGKIYYLYKVSTREIIPTRYNISFEDFSNEFVKLNQHKSDESYYPIELNIDPYKMKSINSTYNDFTLRNSVLKIIKKQFYIDSEIVDEEEIFDYDLYFPKKYFYFENSPKWISEQKLDGFVSTSLQDNKGVMFIIHPFEKNYTRNIFREFIIQKVNNEEKKILNNIIHLPGTFINRLTINFRLAKTDEIIDSNYIYPLYRKTHLSKKVEEIIRALTNIEFPLALTLLCSFSIDLMDEVIMIISLLEATDYNIENLFNIDGLKFKERQIFFDKLKSRSFKNNKSDLEKYLNICENFKSSFKMKNIFKFEKNKKKLNIEYQNITTTYLNSISRENTTQKFDTNIIKKIGENTLSILRSIEKQGKIGSKQGFEEWYRKDNYVENSYDDISYNDLNKFCNTFNFKIETIQKFYKKFIFYQRHLSSLDYRNDPMYDIQSPLQWIKNMENNFKNSFSNMDKIDKIINLFLIGYSQNVCLKKNLLDNDEKYYKITNYGNLINGKQNNSFYKIKNSNFINHKSSLIFYLKLNIKDKTISIISNINEKNLVISNPFYYNSKIITKINLIKDGSKIQRDIYTNDNQIFRNFLNNLNNVFSTTLILWNNKQILPFLTKSIEYIKKIDE